MKVRITVRLLERGRLCIGTVDADTGKPLELVFKGYRHEALRERNRRCERWAQFAEEVTGEEMPPAHY